MRYETIIPDAAAQIESIFAPSVGRITHGGNRIHMNGDAANEFFKAAMADAAKKDLPADNPNPPAPVSSNRPGGTGQFERKL